MTDLPYTRNGLGNHFQVITRTTQLSSISNYNYDNQSLISNYNYDNLIVSNCLPIVIINPLIIIIMTTYPPIVMSNNCDPLINS